MRRLATATTGLVYRAGRGTVEFGSDRPSRSVEALVATSASRREGAAGSSGFTAQPAPGANANATGATGFATLHVARDRSGRRLKRPGLITPRAARTRAALAPAASP